MAAYAEGQELSRSDRHLPGLGRSQQLEAIGFGAQSLAALAGCSVDKAPWKCHVTSGVYGMSRDFETLVTEAVADAKRHEGWDFSHLHGRRHSQGVPWSYDTTVLKLLERSDDVLDIDTGGGEKLLSLYQGCARWPQRAIAIEAYKPNLSVAQRNLASIGVKVRPYASSDSLPFDAAAFSLVINRHGQYSAAEVARILRPGGVFVTQQVGSDMCIGLNQALDAGRPQSSNWALERACGELRSAGLDLLEKEESHGKDLFDDVGAVVWYLCVVPWQIPGFTLDGYREQLFALHASIEANGPFDAGNHLFFIKAGKPN